jgi:hypothetical protein
MRLICLRIDPEAPRGKKSVKIKSSITINASEEVKKYMRKLLKNKTNLDSIKIYAEFLKVIILLLRLIPEGLRSLFSFRDYNFGNSKYEVKEIEKYSECFISR